MVIQMYWCFRSFGLRPQDDKRNPKDDKGNPKDDKRSPQGNKGPVILSAAKNLNRKIPSLFINRINQCILPLTFPAFKLFFTCNGFFNIRESLKVNKFMTMILSSKDRSTPGFMLRNPSLQIVCNTNIESRVVIAGHDVGVVSVIHSLMD